VRVGASRTSTTPKRWRGSAGMVPSMIALKAVKVERSAGISEGQR
jgi:hypothetical protein